MIAQVVRQFDLLHFVQRLLPAFRLRRLRTFGPEPVDHALEVLLLAVAVALGGLEIAAALLAFAAVVVVVARVAGHLPGVDLQRQAGQLAQQKTVVRDQQQRAREGFQEFAEPLHGRDVEIVGRLVEQQDVRLRNQDARQRRTHAPAARK